MTRTTRRYLQLVVRQVTAFVLAIAMTLAPVAPGISPTSPIVADAAAVLSAAYTLLTTVTDSGFSTPIGDDEHRTPALLGQIQTVIYERLQQYRNVVHAIGTTALFVDNNDDEEEQADEQQATLTNEQSTVIDAALIFNSEKEEFTAEETVVFELDLAALVQQVAKTAAADAAPLPLEQGELEGVENEEDEEAKPTPTTIPHLTSPTLGEENDDVVVSPPEAGGAGGGQNFNSPTDKLPHLTSPTLGEENADVVTPPRVGGDGGGTKSSDAPPSPAPVSLWQMFMMPLFANAQEIDEEATSKIQQVSAIVRDPVGHELAVTAHTDTASEVTTFSIPPRGNNFRPGIYSLVLTAEVNGHSVTATQDCTPINLRT